MLRGPALLATAIALGGCAAAERAERPLDASGDYLALRAVAVPAGPAPRFRPPALSASVAARGAVRGLRCDRRPRAHAGAHVELFAAGRVVTVAAGIGVAPPRSVRGAYVRGGACVYPLRTREPTGLIELAHGTRATVGDLFALWGQPLARDRLASFRGRVRAYLDGRRWGRHPGAIPLRRHAQIVLAVGPAAPVHPRYGFPAGY